MRQIRELRAGAPENLGESGDRGGGRDAEN